MTWTTIFETTYQTPVRIQSEDGAELTPEVVQELIEQAKTLEGEGAESVRQALAVVAALVATN